jgi:hypothetical protein
VQAESDTTLGDVDAESGVLEIFVLEDFFIRVFAFDHSRINNGIVRMAIAERRQIIQVRQWQLGDAKRRG